MKNFFTVMIIALAFASTGGCGKSDAPKAKETEKAEATTKTGEGHGAKDAVPGSHEDWCDEHQVPESLDTRCNPSLAAAFKASGDWCEEHGMPESQCTKCNPDLKIVRPPKGK